MTTSVILIAATRLLKTEPYEASRSRSRKLGALPLKRLNYLLQKPRYRVGTGLFAGVAIHGSRQFRLFSAAVQSGTGIEVPGPIVGASLLCRQYEQLSLLILTAAALTVSVLASLPTLVVM